MPKIAKLAIQSNLPQLDRLFDYEVPEDLANEVQVGSRVKVPFGRSKKSLDGFVVEINEESEFRGNLSGIESVLGERPALTKSVFELCQQLAQRSVSPLGAFLKIAVPAHMPRAYSSHLKAKPLTAASTPELSSTFAPDYIASLSVKETRHFVLSEPRLLTVSSAIAEMSTPAWLAGFIAIAASNIRNGKSTLILVPDYREHEITISAFSTLGFSQWLVDYSQDQPKSKNYAAFLTALDNEPRIIVGSRSAAFAPAMNLGSILIFDESDRSYIDQSSPYLSTRDVVFIRQSIEGCSMVFAAHSMSTEMHRLVETKYLTDSTLKYAAPKVSVSQPGLRVDSHAYSAIKLGLTKGSVLVQVASLGSSISLYCKQCDRPATCQKCQGPLWVDSDGSRKCRWCNGFALEYSCSCGSTEFIQGRAGATRTAAELGRAFPTARVIESTGDKKIIKIPAGKNLVVATNGAEPYVEGGYSAVVLLDAKVLVSRQSLRSTEEAVRVWSNAIAKGGPDCSSVLVGVSSELAKLLSLWNHSKLASEEYKARQELSLPPAVRLGSITAEHSLVAALNQFLSQFAFVSRIGPAPVENRGVSDQWRLIFKYPYSEGIGLAKSLKAEVARIASGKTRTLSSGRSARAITVKMNDAEVV